MQFLTRALIALTALLPLACSAAESPKYEAGTHYKSVRTPQQPADPSKIEVMEVFSYGCPHCFQFESNLDKWLAKKPADVAFVRMPHTLGQPAGIVRNKAMYTAEMLGGFDKFHRALFASIHGQGKLMSTVEEVRGLFASSTGLKAEDFDGAYNSFAVDSRFRIAENQIREMGIASVPTLVVDGKWYASPRTGGGFPELLAITDHLVAKARQERGKSR
jgi:protein dithiol oxidoreductase (disulfide-forming)